MNGGYSNSFRVSFDDLIAGRTEDSYDADESKEKEIIMFGKIGRTIAYVALLMVVMIAGLILTACGGNSPKTGSKDPDPQETAPPATPDPNGTRTPNPNGTRTPNPQGTRTPCAKDPC